MRWHEWIASSLHFSKLPTHHRVFPAPNTAIYCNTMMHIRKKWQTRISTDTAKISFDSQQLRYDCQGWIPTTTSFLLQYVLSRRHSSEMWLNDTKCDFSLSPPLTKVIHVFANIIQHYSYEYRWILALSFHFTFNFYFTHQTTKRVMAQMTRKGPQMCLLWL